MPEGSQRFVARVAGAAAIAAAILALFVGLWALAALLLLLFGGILVAVGLRALSDPLAARTGLDRGRALAFVVVILAVGTASVGVLVGRPLAAQTGEMIEHLPRAVDRLEQDLAASGLLRPIVSQLRQEPVPPEQEAAETLSVIESATQSAEVMAWAGSLAGGAATALLSGALVLVIGLYLAAQPKLYVNGLLDLLPERHRGRARQVLDEMGDTLGWWLVGQLASMVVVGAMTGIGLWALGLPLAMAIAVVTGLLCFIPNFGPALSLIPAVLVALGTGKVPHVVVLYAAVQTVESYLLTPLIQRKAIDMPPVVLIMSQIFLGALLGLPGLALAAPLTAVAIVAGKRLYRDPLVGPATAEPPEPLWG